MRKLPRARCGVRERGSFPRLRIAGRSDMPKNCVAVGVAVFVALFVMVVARPAGAQGVPGGPGCHRLMNQAACVACVKKNLPQVYDPQGSAQWCARQIAERRAKGLGAEPLGPSPNRISNAQAKAEGARNIARESCITLCISRGAGRSRASCSPWCQSSRCYRSTDGTPYCVQ